MNPLDALRLMVDAYPGGRDAVALRRGKSPEVLRKELAGAAGFKLGVVDACAIAAMCAEVGSEHADAYAQAVAAHCGAQVVALPQSGDTGADLVQRASAMVKEAADVMGSVAAALVDGAVSSNDVRAIEREAAEVSAAILSMLRAMRAAHQQTLRAAP
ncbi:phage regulatory CII family protein [Melaminivora sp.]|uniref:phage regulatory CII family protein n=1 Tax=Melaminivora sp. TaxID=1933032 RepID=UPI0028AC37BD|nr:phage regulatory CII family protein [Melaminivora sp.]